MRACVYMCVLCAYSCVSVNVCIKNVICQKSVCHTKFSHTYRYSDNIKRFHSQLDSVLAWKPRQTTISHVTTLSLPPNICSLCRSPREQGKAI